MDSAVETEIQSQEEISRHDDDDDVDHEEKEDVSQDVSQQQQQQQHSAKVHGEMLMVLLGLLTTC